MKIGVSGFEVGGVKCQSQITIRYFVFLSRSQMPILYMS